MKIHLVGAESFHVDRQTDMTKLPLALSNFAKAPKKFFVIPTGGIKVLILFNKKQLLFPWQH
jgi:hypothetical protein